MTDIILTSVSPPLILSILSVVLVVLVIILIVLEIKHSGKIQKLSYPLYDYTVKKAQKKAQRIIWDATKQAREIIVAAELRSIKETAKKNVEAKNLEETYHQQLDSLAKELRERFKQYAREAGESYKAISSTTEEEMQKSKEAFDKEAEDAIGRFTHALSAFEKGARETEERYKTLSQSIEESVSEQADKSTAIIAEHVETTSKELAQAFADLKKGAGERIDRHLDEGFEEARKVIDEYRKKRIALIDNQIVSLVEHTAAIALQKELTVSDHADLVYQALEEAKKEGIFIK